MPGPPIATPIVHSQDSLGEGPLWHPDEACLYWVDIHAQRIHRYDPAADAHRVMQMNERVTALGIRERGGFVAVGDSGFGFWDGTTPALEPITDPEAGKPDARFNDGKVGPGGRYWAGTMTLDGATSKLYCLDAGLQVHTWVESVTISNGIGWSPDAATMYYVDSLAYTVNAFDYNRASGQLTHRRAWLSCDPANGVPDGLTVDAEGCIWLAFYDGWRVARYAPDAALISEIRLPVQRPTCCAFGGVGLRQLFITTADDGLSPSEKEAQPHAGDLFVAETGTPGLPIARFSG